MTKALIGFGRRYWVLLAALLLIVTAFGVAAPAWASPPQSGMYQTVPRPTPTPSGGALATATPRPDDDDDDADGDAGGDESSGDRDVPVFLIAPEENATASNLTASVTVASLNVREGPGTEFAVVGALASGDIVSVLYRNEDNAWWYICCLAGTSDGGWTVAQLLTPDFDRATSADLIPIFGVEAVEEVVAEAASAVEEPTAAPSAEEIPITLKMSVEPPYLQPGQLADIVLEVSNPNLEEALNIELSDQLPPEVELISVTADGNGRVSEQVSDAGTPLVLVRWQSAPAGGTVRATLSVKISEDLEYGQVFDNLAAARGSNASYTSSAVSIGMPPILLPGF